MSNSPTAPTSNAPGLMLARNSFLLLEAQKHHAHVVLRLLLLDNVLDEVATAALIIDVFLVALCPCLFCFYEVRCEFKRLRGRPGVPEAIAGQDDVLVLAPVD